MATSKPGDLPSDPPFLMATALPPEASYQTVTIDDQDAPFPEETTPLMGVLEQSDRVDSSHIYSPSISSPAYQDWQFALFFCGHLALVIYFFFLDAPEGYDSIDQNLNYTLIKQEMIKNIEFSDDFTPEDLEEFENFVATAGEYIQVYPSRVYWWNIIPATLFGFLFVYATLVAIVRPFATLIVTSSLVGALALTLLVFVAIVAHMPGLGAIILAIFLGGAVVWYVQLVWPMIGFTSVNLKIALTGINANRGVYILAFFYCQVAIFWTISWCYVMFGTMFYLDDQCNSKQTSIGGSINRMLEDDSDGTMAEMEDCGNGWIFLFFLISLYWTSKVLMNTVEVTVAGVMATWCFNKEAASGCCSMAVASSLYRSVTFSFGSICMGSLYQGIMQVLRKLIPDQRSRRSNDQVCGICLCLFECIGRVLDDVLDYFHQWAYVYVGIYGYSYLESGQRVLELFTTKGWTAIITERLASYVISCMILTMGIITGIFTIVLTMIVDSKYEEEVLEGNVQSFVYGPLPSIPLSFIIGFIIGTVVSAVIMSVVRGAVNTLIVCFADSPTRLEENHPELTKEMVDAWSDAFPDTIAKYPTETPVAEPILASVY